MTNLDKAQEKYDSQLPECDLDQLTWTCCGGIELWETEKCPVCGEGYDDD